MTDRLFQIVQPTPAAAPRMGLLTSALVVDSQDAASDIRWEDGFTYTPEPVCDAAFGFNPQCGIDPDFSSHATSVEASPKFQPVGIAVSYTCSTLGSGAINVPQRAQRALNNQQQRIIEKELEKGTIGVAAGFTHNNHLTDSTVQDITGSTDADCALSILEAFAAQTISGSRAMIHAPIKAVNAWMSNGHELLYRSGNLLLTVARDTIVVPGSYVGDLGPSGAAAGAGNVWAWVTGMVEVYRSPIKVLEPMDPRLTSQNQRLAIAWRNVGILYPPCSAAATKVALACA